MAFMASNQTPCGNQAAGPTNDALYKELWHACAGPLVTLPREGERVYYFPQGHMEQVQWDEPSSILRPDRVSPWELDPLVKTPSYSSVEESSSSNDF